MQLFKYCLSIFLVAGVALADAGAEAPSELKIDVTHLPDSCVTKAKTGDGVQVHYVS